MLYELLGQIIFLPVLQWKCILAKLEINITFRLYTKSITEYVCHGGL